ncbi:hypothetical protein CSKR_112082 [Clonorchis sinensis]|uniref:Uncharacterized protein n=1 Tax=Clonorchis sinensis TaxID=79923 RepID=A0A419QD37_CLOSI|nr:hypothetical protein CSKR_112082 [Clonorchis sinensis]
MSLLLDVGIMVQWSPKLSRTTAVFCGKCKSVTIFTDKSPRLATPNLEDQETVFFGALTTDQHGMRDSLSVAETFLSTAQWVAKVRTPSHHGKVRSLRDAYRSYEFIYSSFTHLQSPFSN